MGYKKPKETTANILSQAQFPNHGETYTVIRHKFLIDASKSILATHGFNITNEVYRATGDCNIAQGVYHIQSTKDSELGMMFAWTNSYNKQVRFQCGIGAYVFVCNNGMVSGDMSTYARKHTGNADSEAFNHIMSQIKKADLHFDKLIADKDELKKVSLSIKEQSELAGRLFMDKELVDATQMSCIKNEIKKPSYTYEADRDNAWTFYNHVTHALKKTHPRSWMSDQQKFHEFMTAELLSQSRLHNSDQNIIADVDEVDPRQLSIIDELENKSFNYAADMEAQDDMFGEFKI
jgi:hypothetical protein|tara:strand:+ start:951 stop:1826 length:876 start_codon:yes stop_codon:yes gene_type:complete